MAPVPDAQTRTRRALLVAAGSAFAGMALGAGLGIATAPAREPVTGGPSRSDPSGDAELEELRRLATEAPIDELVANWLFFLDEFATNYRNDAHLAEGVLRLADFVAATPHYEQRSVLARVLIDTIDRGEPHLRDRCASAATALRGVL